jgi:gas vesicle protein
MISNQKVMDQVKKNLYHDIYGERKKTINNMSKTLYKTTEEIKKSVYILNKIFYLFHFS